MFPATLFAPLLAAGFAPLLASAASIPAQVVPRSSVPAACQFPLGRENDYGYDDESSVSGRSTCIGWPLGTTTCDWSAQQQSDAVSAFTQQIAKQGQLQTSTVGVWTASFGLLTTAFASRDTIYFDHVFDNAQKSDATGGAGALEYYYLDNGNYLVLQAAHC